MAGVAWHDPGVDDRALVQAVLTGDRDAFRHIVEREQGTVYRACLRILGRPHDAEDVAQESFVIAFRSLSGYRGDGPLGGWLPDPGGILYNGDMDLFFQTFYKNPKADWRYILGFEPGLMRPEDLDVLRKIQWNYGDARAYEPWVKKMRAQDRLAIRGTSGAPPRIPELEWHYAVSHVWLGRLPRH